MKTATIHSLLLCSIWACGPTAPSDTGETSSGGDHDGASAATSGTTNEPVHDSDTNSESSGDVMSGAPRLVFVTSESVSGDFAVAASPDYLCNHLAALAGLLRTFPINLGGEYMQPRFRAWVPAGALGVADRLYKSTGPYQRLDGVTIAYGWDDLVDGTLLAPISLTEQGATVGTLVWTGTYPGGAAGQDCAGWTGGAGASAVFGHTSSVDGEWTTAKNGGPHPDGDCSRAHSLYCFETYLDEVDDPSWACPTGFESLCSRRDP
jgi:hypothetical protein